jgi:hypothetical protein
MFGLDLIGLARFAAVAGRNFPANFALGCFSSTFGDARPAVDAILKTGKCPVCRIHLAWHDNHSFGKQDFPAIEFEAKKWRKLVNRYPTVKWYFSPACEHTLKRADAELLLSRVAYHLPSAQMVDNPMRRTYLPFETYLNETHGADALPLDRPYGFSFDGSSAVDANVTAIKHRLKDAEYLFFWIPQFNGRRSTADNTPRPERTYWPTPKLIRSVSFLATTRGEVNLPDGWLLKSHAEDTGDSRANKPVFIVPLKSTKIVLRANSQIIAECPYFGLFSDGRHRYYVPRYYGYEIAKQAQDISTSCVVEVWADHKRRGTCNLAFRQGDFR